MVRKTETAGILIAFEATGMPAVLGMNRTMEKAPGGSAI